MGTNAPARPVEGGAAPVTRPRPPEPSGPHPRVPMRNGARPAGRFDPAPPPARLAGVCGWAAALVLLGLPVAGRAWVALLTGTAPGWFEPIVLTCGFGGILLTAAAFGATTHRSRLPWLLLTAASVALLVNGTVILLL